MPVTNLADLHRVANHTLREVIGNERARKWPQVVRGYRRLIGMLNQKNLPPDLHLPHWYSLLMYELHVHLGMALQHVNEHLKAVNQYTQAIEAVAIPKNGCTAGCNSNSCLMTPLHARRAFAQAAVGDFVFALRDAEKAVVLDNKNPDVYCVRALVKNSMNQKDEALTDVQQALKHNKSHPCALILHGALLMKTDINRIPRTTSSEPSHPSHVKACSINPDCYNYLHVDNFKKKEAVEFYERFLYSLSVPHTVSEIPNLVPYLQRSQRPPSGKSGHSTYTRPPSGKSVHSQSVRPYSGKSVGGESNFSTYTATTFCSPEDYWFSNGHEPGVFLPMRSPVTFLKHTTDEHAANFRCGTPTPPRSGVITVVQRRKEYGNAVRDHVTQPRPGTASSAWSERPMSGKSFQSSVSKRRSSFSSSVNTQEIPVFTSVNVKDAPRMYYKPWKGDRLPVKIRQPTPEVVPFKP